MMRWVSEAALLRQGWVDLGAINSEEALQTLADNSSASDGARNRVFTKIRTPAHLRNSNPATNDGVLPWMKGDGVNYPDGPMDMFSITEEQYLNLKRWAKETSSTTIRPSKRKPSRSSRTFPSHNNHRLSIKPLWKPAPEEPSILAWN